MSHDNHSPIQSSTQFVTGGVTNKVGLEIGGHIGELGVSQDSLAGR